MRGSAEGQKDANVEVAVRLRPVRSELYVRMWLKLQVVESGNRYNLQMKCCGLESAGSGSMYG